MISKQREALSKASIALSWATHGHLTEGDAEKYLAIVDAALAEPLKNCEVGTEYEQSERFSEFCRHHQKGCGLGYGSKGIVHPKVTCPAFKNIECSVVWSLMPYKKEGE